MKNHKVLKISLIVLAAIILLVGGFGLWLFKSKPSLAKEKVLNFLPVPIATVGSKPVFMKDYQQRLAIAQKISSSGNPDAARMKQDVYNSYLEEQKMRIVASSHNVTVSDRELQDEYSNVSSQASASGQGNFSDFLKAYGLDAETFKQVILKPEVLNTKLVVWFNQQQNLNSESYKTADSLVSKLNNGEKFEDVAKNYSEDPSSKSLGGDMGFASVSDLLPELRGDIDPMNIGQVKVIASRYGLHITKLVEKDNNGPQNSPRLHLQQIFVKPNDFSQWYQNETKNIRVRTLINPVN